MRRFDSGHQVVLALGRIYRGYPLSYSRRMFNHQHSLPESKCPKKDAVIDNGGRGVKEVAYDGGFFGDLGTGAILKGSFLAGKSAAPHSVLGFVRRQAAH